MPGVCCYTIVIILKMHSLTVEQRCPSPSSEILITKQLVLYEVPISSELAEASLPAAHAPPPWVSSSLNMLSSLELENRLTSSSEGKSTFRLFRTSFIPLPCRARRRRFLAFRLPLGKSSLCDSRPLFSNSLAVPPLPYSLPSDSSASSLRLFLLELVW